MHSDWFNGIEILQGRRQHEEKVGYCYPSGLEKTVCKWEIYVPLVRTRLNKNLKDIIISEYRSWVALGCAYLGKGVASLV
jgi:hypothetical protein